MSSQSRKVLPFFPTSHRTLLSGFIKYVFPIVLVCLISLQISAQSTIGIKTDLGIYPEGVAPALPRAGNRITDRTFGTQIMRVTDQNDGPGFSTAYSYWSTFNLNNTRLLVQSETGTPLLYTFDPSQFALVAKQPMIMPPGTGNTSTEDAVWSAIDPDVLLIHRGAVLYAFNARLRTYSIVADLTSQFPSGAYMHQMSVSRNDDVFAFTVKNADYSIAGYAVWQRSTGRVIFSERTQALDEVQIDKTGRYLVVKTGQSGAGVIEVKIVDLQTMLVASLTDNQPDFSPGHSDNGRGIVVGNDNWTNRLTFRSLATPHVLRTVLSFGNNWAADFHVSLLSDNEDWALLSFYGQMNAAFNGELVLVATDGSQRVRRLAHHHSVYRNYQDAPRANISRDGRFIAFTSNWGGSGRSDLFVAQVPSFENPASSPVASAPSEINQPAAPVIDPAKDLVTKDSMPAVATAVFETIAGFSTATVNSLQKLPAPYYATAQTAGVVSGDGRFSFKYNPAKNGRGVSVWLDNGRGTFGLLNQGKHIEVRINGKYQTDFLVDVNKTITIERIGDVFKIWEDATLRYSSRRQGVIGAAKFRVHAGGDPSDLGLGINNASVTGVSR